MYHYNRQLLVCHTNGGADPNKPCVFPFNYNGINYTSCTTVENNGIHWCSTEVDANGNHVGVQWGNCGPGCTRGNETYTCTYIYVYI